MGVTTRNIVPLRRVLVGLIVVVSVALALTAAIVDGTGNQTAMEKSLLRGSNVPVPIPAILERACQDCHSEETVWPWYSHIAPIARQIHTDVEMGRAFMDLSKWNDFTESERRGYRAAIGAAVQNHVMPPPKYVWLHPEARLSSDELELVRAWAVAKDKTAKKQ
jgi:Haem-binding domain